MSAFSQKVLRSSVAMVILAGSALLMAKPVSEKDAEKAAKGWLKAQEKIKKVKPVKPNKPVSTSPDGPVLSSGNARPLFYIVELEKGGFVAMSPDDELPPVVARVDKGTFEADPENPLYGILMADMEARLAALQASSRLRGAEPASSKANSKLWASLMERADQAFEGTRGVSVIEDVWVSPLVTSRWNQRNAGDGTRVYNLYVPNGYPCGCTATALSQLIRYYEWPAHGIGARNCNISVDDADQVAVTRGGDGKGGAYDFSKMPLVPSRESSQEEIQMIGSLVWDVAISLGSSFTNKGTSASLWTAPSLLKNVYSFKNAVTMSGGAGTLTNNGNFIININSNLDAGCPSLMGIHAKKADGTLVGHAVICDGYGYQDGVAFHHVNLGWGGNSTAWYNFPTLDAAYDWDMVSTLVHNIFPQGTGYCVSGRVADANNQGLEGVHVTLGARSMITNAKGIYAFDCVPQGKHQIQIEGEAVEPASKAVDVTKNLWAVNFGGTQQALAITSEPQDVTIPVSGKTVLRVAATGENLKYQWYLGESGSTTLPRSGATSATYTAGPLKQSASFWVRVSNAEGHVDSRTVRVTVGEPVAAPVIAAQPQDVKVMAGEQATLSVEATGEGMTFQWFEGLVGNTAKPVPGATGAALRTFPLTQSTSFWVRVTNAGGSVDSRQANVTVEIPVVDPVKNGGFEAGSADWTGSTARIAKWPTQPAFEGTQCAWLCGSGKRATHTLSQSVTIPAASPKAEFQFQMHIDTLEKGTRAYDKLDVQILDGNKNVLQTLVQLSNVNAAPGYKNYRFDLSAYKGQTVTLSFKANEDSFYQTSFVIDSVSLQLAQ